MCADGNEAKLVQIAVRLKTMSARALLLPLPGGLEVFRTKHAVKSGYGDFAPLKKGVTGWAVLEDQIAECVTFGRVWKIRNLYPVLTQQLESTVSPLTAEDSMSSPRTDHDHGDPRFPATQETFST